MVIRSQILTSDETVRIAEWSWRAQARLMKTARNSISFLNHPKNAEHRSYDYSNTTDYLFLHELVSVKSHLRPETVSLSFFLVVSTLALVVGLSALFAVSILVSISAILAVFYLAIMLFKVVVTVKAMGRNPFIHISAEELHALDEQLLPRFSVVIPLYQEAVVIPHIMRAMTSLDYPVDKLEVIITLEQYDHE